MGTDATRAISPFGTAMRRNATIRRGTRLERPASRELCRGTPRVRLADSDAHAHAARFSEPGLELKATLE